MNTGNRAVSRMNMQGTPDVKEGERMRGGKKDEGPKTEAPRGAKKEGTPKRPLQL
ncbi:hypothetical protein [Streptomyces sp. NPDC020298]|uniref:hypothetical protein n=1 Tax=unclassified Streptomyces TaxID=2593676 RepID=UPI0033FFC780